MEMETLFDSLKGAIETGGAVVVVATILMILVTIFTKMFGKYVPPYWRPLATSLVGVVTVTAGALAAGVEWYWGVASGILVGTSAGGQWSLWGKYIAKALNLKDHGPLN